MDEIDLDAIALRIGVSNEAGREVVLFAMMEAQALVRAVRAALVFVGSKPRRLRDGGRTNILVEALAPFRKEAADG